MIYENFRIAIGISISILLLLTGIGIAEIPPPVNQNIGFYDTNENNMLTATCIWCHPNPALIHNLTIPDYTCIDCHPNGNSPSDIERNCNNCHNGTAYYANPNLIIGIPHHNTTKRGHNPAFDPSYLAINRKCKVCHGASTTNDYNDLHTIYPTSMMSDVCNNCHGQNLSKIPPILSNNNLHHDAINTTQGFLCTYCHDSSGSVFNFEKCEDCHSVERLHDIQYMYSSTNGIQGFGHKGSNLDCEGCHIDRGEHKQFYGGDCKNDQCHPVPITTPISPLYPAKIRGMKFNDSNGNGIREPDETGVSGINITIINATTGIIIDRKKTDINGNYTFVNLTEGFYKVTEAGMSIASQTFPADGAPHYFYLGANEVKTDVDFGNIQLTPGRIRGKKFNDTNRNGILDDGEIGIPGITIISTPLDTSFTTNSIGNYTFVNVPVGTQTVYELFVPGYVPTTPTFVNVEVMSGQTSYVNFGNAVPLPPPPDVIIPDRSILLPSGGSIPYILRPGLNILEIQKDLSSISDVINVNLELRWWDDGTTKTAEMVNDSGIWKAIFYQPFPRGLARMTFNVDIYPAGSGIEDMIQIGDIMFIDPSGQIRNVCNNQPIEGAEATLFVESPPTTGNFIVSPSQNQLEVNPQITSENGYYGWMTIPGKYKVKVTKVGYNPNESETVIVPPPKTGLDILLTPTDGCPLYNFNGFFQPVENPPVINKVNPGSAIPLKFSLDGYQGMDIFEIDYPKSSVISCEGPVETIGENETVTTGESGLSYNQTIDQYNYVWKTDKKWTDCRQLVMKLNDGSYHRANFDFSK